MNRIDNISNNFSFLEEHLEKKIANFSWLEPCLEGKKETFPYRVKPKGKSTINEKSYCYPENQGLNNIPSTKKISPLFIINLPIGKTLSLSNNDFDLSDTLTKLKRQSFSTNASASSRMFKSRVAVVVNINQAASIDPVVNEHFRRKITRMQISNNLAVRAFGFLWQPEYTGNNSNKNILSVNNAFKLLKVLSFENAEKVRLNLEIQNGKLHPSLRSQIPYGLIRDAILKSYFTRDFAERMRQTSPLSPIYLTTLDPDFLSLRIIKGIFSKAMEQICLEKPYSVIGAGYQAESKFPLIQCAVEIDMQVRSAILKHIPYGAYLPEPFLLVLLAKPMNQPHISELSFKSRNNTLESRRIIQTGKKNEVLDNHMLFIKDGIITKTPDRWKTATLTCPTITFKEFKQKSTLQALRGLSQSHLHPKKWADQIYSALSFKCFPVTDATLQMMHIFFVYDPISRMFKDSPFSRTVFENTMRTYHNPLSDGLRNLLDTATTNLIILKMPKHEIKSVKSAAKASGLAIYEMLKKLSSQTY